MPTDRTFHDEDTLNKARAAIGKLAGIDLADADDLINELHNAGLLIREPEPDRDDQEDRPSENETAQAELPVEYRLTDAYLHGYTQGFREGRHGGRQW